MKQRLFNAALITTLVLFLFLGCEKESTQGTESGTKETGATTEETQAVELTCFLEGLSVREEPGGDWVTTLGYGEQVKFLGEEQKEGNTVYYKIETNSGEIGWSSSYYLIEDGIPAVVISEDKIYSEPEPTGVTPDTLPAAHLLCISPSENSSGKYSEINYVDPEEGYVKLGRYMKSESISTVEDDVDAAVLLLLARREMEKEDGNKEAAVTYLETALEEFPSSALQPIIATELIDYQQEGTSPTAQEIIPLENRITGTINTETVNVRKTPSLSADIILSVQEGTQVSLSKQTTVKEEIRGLSDYWYLADFADGQQGWVYGALITMNE